jgi:hypothetical protein
MQEGNAKLTIMDHGVEVESHEVTVRVGESLLDAEGKAVLVEVVEGLDSSLVRLHVADGIIGGSIRSKVLVSRDARKGMTLTRQLSKVSASILGSFGQLLAPFRIVVRAHVIASGHLVVIALMSHCYD